jgi:chromosome partitioning protein
MRVKSHQEKEIWIRAQYPGKILATLGSRTSVSDAIEESPAKPVWFHRNAPRALKTEWKAAMSLVLSK